MSQMHPSDSPALTQIRYCSLACGHKWKPRRGVGGHTHPPLCVPYPPLAPRDFGDLELVVMSAMLGKHTDHQKEKIISMLPMLNKPADLSITKTDQVCKSKHQFDHS
ncbi:sphingosine-1-phosphate phosphatase 1 [Platysternon megacephalum]|uniref:Sphingosine-1-phosphate phosphatase 1 n=1 Tax=Platysternon megacephalum TaxID=55544 RepID=A0A4D9F2R6_9SAUR|nr:sphingosine-1-phosphate phosphatase 1 [Platysternon megacephalum]